MYDELTIRKVIQTDQEPVWEIIQAVISKGDTYVFAPDTPKDVMLLYWFAPEAYTYVIELNGNIAGTFLFKPNQPGLGAHVANAAFMVHPQYQGKGIGRKMGETALQEAKIEGFLAMQFNIVVSTNIYAKKLWDQLGFTTVGVLPKAFNHLQYGLIDAYVMHRFL